MVERQVHTLEAMGSSPIPATRIFRWGSIARKGSEWRRIQHNPPLE